jgi:hypothetical protein
LTTESEFDIGVIDETRYGLRDFHRPLFDALQLMDDGIPFLHPQRNPLLRRDVIHDSFGKKVTANVNEVIARARGYKYSTPKMKLEGSVHTVFANLLTDCIFEVKQSCEV